MTEAEGKSQPKVDVVSQISQLFHSHGINLGDMGRVYAVVSKHPEAEMAVTMPMLDHHRDHHVEGRDLTSAALLQVMVARALKSSMRKWVLEIHNKDQEIKAYGAERWVVELVLRRLFTSNRETKAEFWKAIVVPLVQVHTITLDLFYCCLSIPVIDCDRFLLLFSFSSRSKSTI